MTVEIRTVGVDEVLANDIAKTVTFLEDPAVVASRVAWRQQEWLPERSWAAVDDGRFVGTLRTLPRSLTVPGADGATLDLDVDALTAVTVAATHRRQGLLRQMITASLAAARERGDATSVLLAAEWPIYGRFGYWPASYWSDIRIDRRRRGATLAHPPAGSLRQLTAEEMMAAAPTVFDVARGQRAGQINRTAGDWELSLSPALRDSTAATRVHIAHGDPCTSGAIDGYVTWQPTSAWDWVNHASIRVHELFATNQAAYTDLWAYVCGIDAVAQIDATGRPVDEPVHWLLNDGRSWQAQNTLDSLWVRLLDVPAALSARRYAVEARVVLDVVDEDLGAYGAGRYLLEGGPDGAQCRATTQSPDLRLSQRALAAVYLGQPSLSLHRSAGMVDEVTPHALSRADAMFATGLAPWLATTF